MFQTCNGNQISVIRQRYIILKEILTKKCWFQDFEFLQVVKFMILIKIGKCMKKLSIQDRNLFWQPRKIPFWFAMLAGQETLLYLPSVKSMPSLLAATFIQPKYSKHWPYLLAATLDCSCSKIINLVLKYVLVFLLLFKFFGWKYIVKCSENSGLII